MMSYHGYEIKDDCFAASDKRFNHSGHHGSIAFTHLYCPNKKCKTQKSFFHRSEYIHCNFEVILGLKECKRCHTIQIKQVHVYCSIRLAKTLILLNMFGDICSFKLKYKSFCRIKLIKNINDYQN